MLVGLGHSRMRQSDIHPLTHPHYIHVNCRNSQAVCYVCVFFGVGSIYKFIPKTKTLCVAKPGDMVSRGVVRLTQNTDSHSLIPGQPNPLSRRHFLCSNSCLYFSLTHFTSFPLSATVFIIFFFFFYFLSSPLSKITSNLPVYLST